MNKYLRMVFKTDENKKVTIRVTEPKEDLDATEVKSIMDTIIANNAIYSTAGDLVAIDGAYIVETATTELDLDI